MAHNHCKEEGELSEEDNDSVNEPNNGIHIIHSPDVIIIDDDNEDSQDIIVKNVLRKEYKEVRKKLSKAKANPKPLSVINQPKKSQHSNVGNQNSVVRENSGATRRQRHDTSKHSYKHKSSSKKVSKKCKQVSKSSRNHKATKYNEKPYTRSSTVASGKLGDILQMKSFKAKNVAQNIGSSNSDKVLSSQPDKTKNNSFEKIDSCKIFDDKNMESIPPLPESPPPCPPLPPPSTLPGEDVLEAEYIKTPEELEKEINSMELDDYAHFLLDTYRDIKEKLDIINKEEETSAKQEETKHEANSILSKEFELYNTQDQDKTEVVDMELASTDNEDDDMQDAVTKEYEQKEDGSKAHNEDENDEELDLLELRRAALASAALRQKQKIEESEMVLSDQAKLDDRKSSTSNTKHIANVPKKRKLRDSYSSKYERQAWEENQRMKRQKERLLRESERIRRAKEDLAIEREALERERRNRHVREELWLWEIRQVLSMENQKHRLYYIMDLFDIDDRNIFPEKTYVRSPSDQRHSYWSPSSERRHRERTHSDCSSPSERRHRERKYSECSSIDSRGKRHSSQDSLGHSQNTHSVVTKKTAENMESKDNDSNERKCIETNQASNDFNRNVNEPVSDNEDEDEEMLRAQLLASVAQRRREKEQKEEQKLQELESSAIEKNEIDPPEEDKITLPVIENAQDMKQSASGTSISSQLNKEDMYAKKQKPAQMKMRHSIPVHEPVIIQLGSSDDDTDDTPPMKIQKTEKDSAECGFFGSLDSFLKAARLSVEQQKELPSSQNEPTTPEALKHLGSYQVEEYKKLKQEIKKRESQKAKSMKRQGDEVKSLYVTVVDKTAVEDSDRTVKIKVDDVKSDISQNNTAQNTEESQDSDIEEKIESFDSEKDKELENKLKIKQVRDLELRTELQRKLLEEDEKKMKEVKSSVHKKKVIVKSSELKSQKLREQMQAAQRILKANLEQITKLNEQAQELQSKIDKRREKFLLLESEMTKMGISVYGNNYRPSTKHVGKLSPVKDTRIIVRRSPICTTVVKNIEPNKPIQNFNFKTSGSTLSSDSNVSVKLTPEERIDEKARLQLLEKKYAQLIQKYKETQSLVTVNDSRESLKKENSSNSVIQRKTNNTDSAAESSRTSERTKRRSWCKNSKFETILKERPTQLEHIETEETMPVSASEEVEEEKIVNLKRSSLLNKLGEPCTHPNLENFQGSPKKEKFIDSNKAGTQITDASSSSRESSPIPMITPSPSFTSLPNDQHLQHLRRLHIPEMAYQPKKSTNEVLSNTFLPLKEYSSHLLRFKSYRFSPYFRTKCHLKLTTVTHSNKIKPSKILCRFDIHGKCNHEECPWQHQSDYEMSSEEVLQDLVSYAPELSGVVDNTPKTHYPVLISQHVELFSQQNSKVTTNEQCILLASQINQKTKHVPPHTTRVDGRNWKPGSLSERLGFDTDMSDISNVHFFSSKIKDSKRGKELSDDILFEQDVRYWMLGTDQMQSMETAVIDNPKDVPMWIKIANKKLHHERSNGEMSLDHALSVLSRALEANKENSDLWMYYLNLYEKRSDHKDLFMLCKQSLKYAPSYQLYWKYLKLLPSCTAKLQLCQKIVVYLCSDVNICDKYRSHCMLEVIIYQVSILVQVGKFKTALKIMQDFMKSEKACSKLYLEDMVLAWLCYIHLSELKVLPLCLFDPANSQPSHIVNKEPFMILWKPRKGVSMKGKIGATESLKAEHRLLCSLFQEAITACENCKNKTYNNEYGDGGIVKRQKLLPLYKNLVLLHLKYNSINDARSLYKQMIINNADFAEAWIFCAEIEYRISDVQQARKILQDAMKRLPCEPQLIHVLAKLELCQGNCDEALELLELCPFHFYQVDISNTKSEDPNLLFCSLLKQKLPLQYKPPELKSLTENCLSNHQLYLWLNYCMLLELQGFTSEVIENYECALSALQKSMEVQSVWKSYLEYMYRQLKVGEKHSSENHKKTFFNLVFQCLVNVPTKKLLPCTSSSTTQYWLDYSFHSDILELLLGCLSNEEKTKACQDFVKYLHADVEFILRSCKHFYKEGHISLAMGCCVVALEEHPLCLDLYKLYLSYANQLGNHREVQHVYRKAIQALPYCIWLWKNYLLFEATSSSSKKKEESVKQLVQKCHEIGVNISDFVNTVLRF